jgi:LacI family transcriptional regulator
MPIKKKNVTMRDVADLVGVSKQTVSAVINDKPGITEETRARVLEAIDQLGYRRDSIARSLRTRRTRTIALIASDVSSPFIGEMAVAAEDFIHGCGCSMILYNTHDDVSREAAYFNDAVERAVDGVIFVSATDENTGVAMLEQAGIPFVAVDRIPDPYSGPCVILNNQQAGVLAGRHLTDLGHSRIAHISGPPWVRMTRERGLGFEQAVKAGCSQAQIMAVTARDWSSEQGYHSMQQILESGFEPTAVFAAGDLLAIGSMHSIRQAGWEVPGNVSVVGMDDLTIAEFQNPPLTTIRQSITELATLGAQMLFDILEEKQLSDTKVVMEPRLVIRQSTAPPPI